jgi:hypothetical protein
VILSNQNEANYNLTEVTSIPLNFGLSTLYPNSVTPPSREERMECFNPAWEYEWEDHRSKIPISYLCAPKCLLARIVMQNLYPISRNSDVPFDRA